MWSLAEDCWPRVVSVYCLAIVSVVEGPGSWLVSHCCSVDSCYASIVYGSGFVRDDSVVVRAEVKGGDYAYGYYFSYYGLCLLIVY